MSRTLFALRLSELITARLTCPKCKSATELPVDQLTHRLGDRQCPVCRADWPGLVGPNERHLLQELAKAIQALQTSPAAAHIEFVMDDPDTTAD